MSFIFPEIPSRSAVEENYKICANVLSQRNFIFSELSLQRQLAVSQNHSLQKHYDGTCLVNFLFNDLILKMLRSLLDDETAVMSFNDLDIDVSEKTTLFDVYDDGVNLRKYTIQMQFLIRFNSLRTYEDHFL